MKGKVEKLEKGTFTDSYGNEYFNITINGVAGSYACKSGATPYFVVGQEQEYEKTEKADKNGTMRAKFKKPQADFQGGGGYKKPMKSITDIKRMVKSNAVHALVTVNSAYNEERLTGKELSVIESFTLGDISGEIEAFGEESSLLTSRLAAVNNTAIAAKYKSFSNGADLIEEATKYYQYVIK